MNNESWQMDVLVDGKWSTNAMRYATQAEAVAAGRELLSRWFVPTDSRASESTGAVNAVFDFKTNRARLISVMNAEQL